ncbi:hypothetical protein [Malacoplasma muris]|uniref:hypothetical protein n=1 Tax=Malacoplasma muris TaxID=2119 RepID=UPI00398F186A
MIGNKVKKILSITGATIAVSGVGLGVVIDHLKNNKDLNNIQLNTISQNILKSGDNIYNLSAALITKEITDTYYKFRLAIAGTNGLVVSNRNFYEIYNNKTYVNKPKWESETSSYVYTVERTDVEKIVSFSYDIQLPNTDKVTIVANDFVVRPIFKNNKIVLTPNLKYITNAIEIIDVDFSDSNYKYYDSLKLIWERKYNIPGTVFNQIETSLFDSEKVFNKEFCGKYIKVTAIENILAPIGLYKSGEYQFANFEVGKITSNIINIKPGMLSQYKLNYEFVDFHTISLKASFISNSSQKENDYEICYWEFRKNYGDWKQLSTSQKDLLEKYDLNNTVEYRFVYRLKNGNDFDISYSNVISFDGINDLKIKKKNNVLFVDLPEFINKYDVDYKWYVSSDDLNYSELDNSSYELLINEKDNLYYKLVLNSSNVFNNFELPSFHIQNEVINEKTEVEFYNSFVDAISVRAKLNITTDKDIHYVWGSESVILKDKTGDSITLPRDAKSKTYWVFAVCGDKITEKTFFDVTEAFKPYLSLENAGTHIVAEIGNRNLKDDSLSYIWYKSLDNKKFNIVENNASKILNLEKHPDAKFVKLKLTYIEDNDILMSSSISI